MKKLPALFVTACLLAPVHATAATPKPSPKPTATKAKVEKKPATKKPVVKKPATKKPVARKKNFPTKKPLKWPPPGFEKKGSLYAKTATPKELLIAGTEYKYIQKDLIKYCDEFACLGIFVGSETGCDWWEISSNVLGIDPADPTQRIIYGSLTTLAPRTKGKTIKPILLVSEEPIADGLGISNYTANCRSGTPTGTIPSNTYTKSPTRS
jgi:hypothetical protein